MEKGNRDWSWGEAANAVVNRMLREDLTKDVTYEQRPKRR